MDQYEFLNLMNVAADRQASLDVRFACLAYASVEGSNLDKAARARIVDAMCERLRVPRSCRDLAILLTRSHPLDLSVNTDATSTLAFLESCDALRKPLRFFDFLEAVTLVELATRNLDSVHTTISLLRDALAVIQSVSTADLSIAARNANLSGPEIGEFIRRSRVHLLSERLFAIR